MKIIYVIATFILLLVAGYIIYGAFTESWGRTEDIMLIILLAGGLINSSLLEWNRKRERRKENNKT